MARSFNGSNQALTSAATIDLSGTNKASVSLWLWWDSFANDNDLAFEFTQNFAVGGFHLNPNESSTASLNIAVRGNAGFNQSHYTRPSAAAWHHYVCIYDMSQATDECSLYLDGSLATPLGHVSSANNTGNFANATLYFMNRGLTSLFGAGRMAEFAIYPGEVLNASEAAALARGVHPLRVRPSSNPYYWPIWGLHSPEICLRSGGPSLTLTNTPPQVNHAPVRPFTRSDRTWTAYDEAAVAAATGHYYRRLLRVGASG